MAPVMVALLWPSSLFDFIIIILYLNDTGYNLHDWSIVKCFNRST